jgi:hypothetical protein
MLMRRGAEEAARYDLSALRFVASVGEPLNPEAVVGGAEALGRPVHDNWWQTETGAIMISNLAACDIRPGSMGRPLPGVEAGLLERGPDGRALVDADRHVRVLTGAAEGELALRVGWPSMFRAYVGAPERYAACFADGWYLTGDIVRRDADGWFGIAVSLRGGGLAAPVVRDADTLGLDDLMARMREAAERARTARLRSSEIGGATLTVTNLGELGVDVVAGVIHPPQVALVGFGTVRPRPWVDGDTVVIRPVVTASLSADHRATDGATGARLLHALDRHLHRPDALQ